MGAFPGAVPINQLNSLPLLSADQLAFGGTVSVIGGAISRYFSPVQTGINGAAGTYPVGGLMNVEDADPSGHIAAGDMIVRSNLLDVRGCTRFTVLAAIKLAGANQEHDAGLANYTYTLNLRLMSPVAADIPSVSPLSGVAGASDWPFVGQLVFPSTGAAAFPAYNSAGRGWMVGGRDTGTVQTGSLGFIYLWFNFLNGAANTGAQLYASLYCTS